MKYAYLLLSGSLLVSLSTVGKELKTPDFSLLNQQISQTKAFAKLPFGTSIIAIKNDEIIYSEHSGFADVANQIPVNSNTPFYIASATKPFTALTMLLNKQQKLIDTSMPLSKMFPEIDIAGVDSSRVTIKHLLTHTSGIENNGLVLATAYSGIYNQQSLERLVYKSSTSAGNAVGDFKYSNVGYNIASVFTDRALNQPWQRQLQTQIFDPLGMKQTSATRSAFKFKSNPVAKPYSMIVPPRSESVYLEKYDDTLHAAGGMFASSGDLARFIRAQINQGKIDGRQVFPIGVINKSQQKQVTIATMFENFTRDGYAWGWYTGDYKGERMLHHFGGFAGTYAHLSFMPEKKLGLVVLNNEDFLSRKLTSLIADYVYGVLLNEPDINQTIKQRFAALNKKVVGIDSMVSEQQARIQSRTLQLSLPKSDYVGEYRHGLLGSMFVSLNQSDSLVFSWGRLQAEATGLNKPDHVRIAFNPSKGEVGKFNVDATQGVQQFHYDGQVFERVP